MLMIIKIKKGTVKDVEVKRVIVSMFETAEDNHLALPTALYIPYF